MLRHSSMLRAAAAVLVLLAAAGARAQRTAYDLERLWLDPSARGSLVLGDGRTLPARSFRVAVAGGWERAPLTLTDRGLRGRGLFADEHRIGDVVRDRWTVHVVAAVALMHRLELGARAPITVSQEGKAVPGLPKLRGALAGTPSAMLRWSAISQEDGAPLSVALAAEAGFPIRHSDDVDGDPKPILVPRLEVGHTAGHMLVAANVGGNLRTKPLKLTGNQRLHSELTAGVVAATTDMPLRVELSARGAVNADGLGQHGELLAGARYGLGPAELFALAGPGFGSSPGTPTFRALVGLAVAPSFAAAPAPAKAAAPLAVVVPPDPCAPGQSHDPAQCPALDDDGDGIANGQDRCPTVKGVASAQGCPDRDGDGIADAEDVCPDQPGSADDKGCPVPARAELKGATIDIREKVQFDTGKATIQERSNPLLDDVARVIAANPAAGKIRIEGHTDSRGAAALNRKLSRARAEAVRAYLVSRGVDAARLEAAGYGPDKPTATNATAAGREANRRVEFSVLGVEQ